jgi:hypothetical protein
MLGDRVVEPNSSSDPGIICFPQTPNIERVLFPRDSNEASASITINEPNVVLDGIAFSSKKYNDKYRSDAEFYRMCAGEIPFTVGKKGVALALHILWGTKLGGKREEKIFEFVKVFGSEEVTPLSDADVQNAAFRDFGHAAAKLGNELDNWDFTKFVQSLAGPVDRNVLLLVSYKSEADFEKLKCLLPELGYRGFLLKDSPDLPIQSNLEKLLAAIICSCFVIVLDKQASGHIAELGNMLQFRFRPVLVLRDVDVPTTAFLEDQLLMDPNFRVVVDPSPTASSLIPHIKWARDRSAEKEEGYNTINYWRTR